MVAGHPPMYGHPKAAHDFGRFPEGGGYPTRFLEWAYSRMGCSSPDEVLHVCSGSMRRGVTVDVREGWSPTVVADARALPFLDESFDFILIDPPYAQDYAETLYGIGDKYPEPTKVIKEAGRVLRTGGMMGFLHFVVPYTNRPLKIESVYGITTGNGTAIRAWSLITKVDPEQVTWRNRWQKERGSGRGIQAGIKSMGRRRG